MSMARNHESGHYFNNQNIVNFIAGLLAGFMSVTICNPLDIARSRLNVLVHLPSSRTHRLINIMMENIWILFMHSKPFGKKKESKDSMRDIELML